MATERKKILVVDDEPYITSALRKGLAQHGLS
jgi:DNA-binding response OmpR family regulator